MKTIDITPTWASLILPMIEVLKNPNASFEAKNDITYELIRLAKVVDGSEEFELFVAIADKTLFKSVLKAAPDWFSRL